MKKLFVIGNGFDSAHEIPTSYDEFRKYLCDTYMNGNDGKEGMPMVPGVSIGPKGEEICDMSEVAEFLVYMISMAEPDGSKWSQLENSLGKLDYSEAFDFLPNLYDEDGDTDYWGEAYNNEDMASNLYTVVSYVKELFGEWIDTIDIEKAESIKSFSDLVESEDIFLTFNYTETLEQLYKVREENVCHIHGKQGEDILFGHGSSQDYTDKYMSSNIGSENELAALDLFLKKDTKQALKNHQDFFNKMDGAIKEIYSMGFSFGEVDLIYIKEICKNLSDDAVWYLNDYEPSEIPEFQDKLRRCGFKGKFATF